MKENIRERSTHTQRDQCSYKRLYRPHMGRMGREGGRANEGGREKRGGNIWPSERGEN